MDTQTAQALGHERLGQLLLQYSLPAIVATAATSLYNIIDRMFIGQGVGAMAISGLAITLPLMNLAIAFGALVGAGASTLVSIRLGEGKGDAAARILGNTVVLNLLLSTCYSAILLLLLDPALWLFGASEETLPYARQFMQIILVGNVFMHSYIGLNNIMRASGYPRKAMTTTLFTVGLNLVLAPLFIFVFHWGIRGAAMATVFSQLVGFGIVLVHFMGEKHTVHFLPGHFALDRGVIRDIFAIGMSPFAMQIGASVVGLLMNWQLVRHGGDFAVGAFGVINSVLLFVAMIVMGLTQGMQPIAGFNFGARQYGRSTRVFKYTIYAATTLTCMGFLAGELFPGQIARAFTKDPDLSRLVVQGMRIALLLFPLVGFQMVTSTYFQSIGRAKISIYLSLSRQVLFLIPALLLLPRLWALTGVWMALPASDLAASIVTFLVLKHEVRKIKALHQSTLPLATP
ncbi:MAG TPA: MATE family efflux transporter [Fibrobacteraceae bacterium]|nr:MATE family efflux transporter [Fibrobacteraceae bacterium]